MNGLISVANFLLTTTFSLMIMLLWLRFVLRYLRVSHLNPVSQIVHRFTTPLLGFAERMVYAKITRLPRYDWVCFGAIVLLEAVKFLLLVWLNYSAVLPLAALILFVLASLIVEPCNILFYAILIRVILSWLRPDWERHPMASILILITEPPLHLGRKIIPDISGFDFSPFVIMVLLKVITLFIAAMMPLPLLS